MSPYAKSYTISKETCVARISLQKASHVALVVGLGKGATNFLEVFGRSLQILSASFIHTFNAKPPAILDYTNVMVTNRNVLSLYSVDKRSCLDQVEVVWLNQLLFVFLNDEPEILDLSLIGSRKYVLWL